MKRLLAISSHAIFWLWNTTFLVIVCAGILPAIAFDLLVATFTGEIPIDFFLTLMTLIAVPTICTGVALWRFRQQPLQLMRLFYGVEAPLFLLCLLRLFLLRELTPASTQLLGTVVVCIIAFSLELLSGYAAQSQAIAKRIPTAIAWLQLITHTFMLVVGLYVGILLLYYAVPAAAVVMLEFVKFEWLWGFWRLLTQDGWMLLWWLPISFLLFCFSATLFLAMPSALATFYIQSGYRIIRRFTTQYGRNRTVLGAVTAMTAWMVIFLAFQQQPQIQAFKLLEKPAQTDSDRQALLAKSDTIRAGLVNAYLSPYRYLSTNQDNNHIRVMHSSVFGLPEPFAQALQDSYNQLMSPFLYNGSRSDSAKAEQLYTEFFDLPIQKAEQAAIQHALQSTYNQDEAKAGLLNINQKKVFLTKQQVTVEEFGDWANVELYEVYQNQTLEDQEVFYSFYLPESAVVTGLWLGNSGNLSDRYPFTVSPRGAAQKIYNQEVRRQVDPALIEQVGPRHYRLRAFPVPRQLSARLDVSPQGPQQLHLWLTYKVMQNKAGWPLPQLGEKRNVFWTADTQRIRNGQLIEPARDQVAQDAWLEPFLPAAKPYQPAVHQMILPRSESATDTTSQHRISAKPLTSQDYFFPQGKRFAIILDSSRSMAVHKKEVAETFKWLRDQGFANNTLTDNDADLYVTRINSAQPQRLDDLRRFDPAKQTFYGSLQLQDMLRQFTQLRGDTHYDGVLLITDDSSYELSKDSKDVPVMPAPLWMVHVGHRLPPGYDDATLKAIQDSGGGIATNILEVMQRLATKAALGSSAVNVVDGYAWLTDQAESTPTPQTGFEPVAARQLVLELSKDTKLDQPVQLDAIHAIAKTYDIVTPYSSMIVLVNDRQKEALKKAEAASDRFDRTVESGKEQLNQPSDPLTVSGVPEPEEWLLLGLVAIALLALGRYRHSAVS